MSSAVMPDTDVLVDFLRGRPEALAFVDAHIDEIVLSPIVVAELYAGVRGEPELAVLDALVSGFPVASLTAEVAKAGGLYRRTYGKSHGVGLPDAILAALAQSERAELKTLNVKHYPMFSGLKPPYRKT